MVLEPVRPNLDERGERCAAGDPKEFVSELVGDA